MDSNVLSDLVLSDTDSPESVGFKQEFESNFKVSYHDRNSPKLTDDFKIRLSVQPLTDPYLYWDHPIDADEQRNFNCCRIPTWLCGGLREFCYFMTDIFCLPCKISTTVGCSPWIKSPRDSELAHIFYYTWPWPSLLFPLREFLIRTKVERGKPRTRRSVEKSLQYQKHRDKLSHTPSRLGRYRVSLMNGLVVRSLPTVNSQKLGKLEYKTLVDAIDSKGDWVKFKLATIEGWVMYQDSKQGLEFMANIDRLYESYLVVSRYGLKIRKEPYLDAPIIGRLEPGTVINANGSENGWIFHEEGKEEGWSLVEQESRVFLKKINTKNMFIFDASLMSQLTPREGTYCHGVVVWFERKAGVFSIFGILISEFQNKSRKVFLKQSDGNKRRYRCEWNLAKLYVMHNAHYILKYGIHPRIHFPQESFIAICKELLPLEGELLKLLEPHFKYVRPINRSVLLSPSSPLNPENIWNPEPKCCDWKRCLQSCYQVSAFSRKELQSLFRYGYKFTENFKPKAPTDRLQPYYEAIYEFVLQIVESTELDDLRKWGDALKHYLGYPWDGATLIHRSDRIAHIITDYIFTVSVWHSADHHGFISVDIRYTPGVIRVPWKPGVEVHCCEAMNCCDFFRMRMHRGLFDGWVRCPFEERRLVNVNYNFSQKKNRELQREFHKNLHRIYESQPEVASLIPVGEIAASIEW